MIALYGKAAEEETLKYALKQKNTGKAEDYMLWTAVARIIERWQAASSHHV